MFSRVNVSISGFGATIVCEADVLRHFTFACLRLGAWFSIVPAAAAKDNCWTMWRQWLRWLCKALLGQGKWSKKARDAAVREIAMGSDLPAGETKEDHKERLRQLKKKFSNSLLLSAVLSNNYNWFQMRLVLTVGRHFYHQQAFFGRDKCTPEEHVSFSISMSSGQGARFLRAMWADIVSNASVLARLGLKTTQDSEPQDFGAEWDGILLMNHPGVDKDTVADRIMRFVSCVVSKNLFTYLWHQFSYPAAFAQLLSAELSLRMSGMSQAKAVWDLALQLETMSNDSPALKQLRDKIFWLDYPSVQVRFRVLDHFHFDLSRLDPDVLQWLRRSKTRIGDSAVVENTNKKARRAEATGSSKEINAERILHSIRHGTNALSTRQIPEVAVAPEDWERDLGPLRPSWKARTDLDARVPAISNLPDAFQQ